jgi:hypothetical protein
MSWILRFVLAAFFALPLATQFLPSDEPAPVATITGRIASDVDGSPVANVEVHLIDPQTPDDEIVAAMTDGSGLYTVTQTISNTWKIRFVPTSPEPGLESFYIPEYYNDVYMLAEAELITAEVGAVTPNINAWLATKGQVSGRVTDDATGKPIAGVKVAYYYPGGENTTYLPQTNYQGVYTLGTGLEGAIRLKFIPPTTKAYAIEYYNNSNSHANAEVVNVSKDRPITGIDVALIKGGQIKGIVTSSKYNALLEDPQVLVLDDAGVVLQVGNRYIMDESEFEPLGHYTAPNLPPGDYQLQFTAKHHRPSSQSIHLSEGEVIAGINAQLIYSPTVVSIATSPALPNTILLAFDGDPTPVSTHDGGQSWQVAASTPWVMDPSAFQSPDRDHFFEFYMSAGIALRGKPGEGTRLLIAEDLFGGNNNTHSAVFRSGDFGRSWAIAEVDRAGAATTYQFHPLDMAVSPPNPSKFYLLYYSYLLTSDNAGVSWRDITTVDNRTLLYLTGIAVSPSIADRLYVLSNSQWLQSNDAGSHWDAKNFPVESLILDGKNKNYLYGWRVQNESDSHFGMRSKDGGDSWADWQHQPCTYAGYEEAGQLVASPVQSELLYLRCDNDPINGLYRSEDGGDNWTQLGHESGHWLAIDYGVPGRILFAKAGGLWASSDKGETWQVLLSEYRAFANQIHLPTVVRSEP